MSEVKGRIRYREFDLRVWHSLIIVISFIIRHLDFIRHLNFDLRHLPVNLRITTP